MAARKIVFAGAALRYASILLGRYAQNTRVYRFIKPGSVKLAVGHLLYRQAAPYSRALQTPVPPNHAFKTPVPPWIQGLVRQYLIHTLMAHTGQRAPPLLALPTGVWQASSVWQAPSAVFMPRGRRHELLSLWGLRFFTE